MKFENIFPHIWGLVILLYMIKSYWTLRKVQSKYPDIDEESYRKMKVKKTLSTCSNIIAIVFVILSEIFFTQFLIGTIIFFIISINFEEQYKQIFEKEIKKRAPETAKEDHGKII